MVGEMVVTGVPCEAKYHTKKTRTPKATVDSAKKDTKSTQLGALGERTSASLRKYCGGRLAATSWPPTVRSMRHSKDRRNFEVPKSAAKLVSPCNTTHTKFLLALVSRN